MEMEMSPGRASGIVRRTERKALSVNGFGSLDYYLLDEDKVEDDGKCDWDVCLAKVVVVASILCLLPNRRT